MSFGMLRYRLIDKLTDRNAVPKLDLIKIMEFSPRESLVSMQNLKLRKLIDYSVFVEADELIKVKRRIIRDAKERGYDLDDVLYRYEHHVAPFYHEHLEPLKKEMDVIIPNNLDFRKGLKILELFIFHHLNC